MIGACHPSHQSQNQEVKKLITKSELLKKISDKEHISLVDLHHAVNEIIDYLYDALRDGERVEIRGFGAFTVKTFQPREKRNPKTGEKVQVPKTRAIHFKAGKELRDQVLNGFQNHQRKRSANGE